MDKKSQWNRYISESVQEAVRAEANRTGESINKTAEKLLKLGLSKTSKG